MFFKLKWPLVFAAAIAAQVQVQALQPPAPGIVVSFTDGPYVLSVGCATERSGVWIDAPAKLLPRSDAGAPLTLLEERFDTAGKGHRQWRLQQNGRSLALSEQDAFDFIREMTAAAQVEIEMISRAERVHSARFDLTGFRSMTKPMAEACGWTGY